MRIKKYFSRKPQIVTFMVIGAGTTVLDLVVFNGILIMAGISALSFVFANTVAFVTTNIVKYIVNSHLTFDKAHEISWFNGFKFILVSSGTFLVFNFLIYMAFLEFPMSNLPVVNALKLLVGFVNGGVNFLLFRALVFS